MTQSEQIMEELLDSLIHCEDALQARLDTPGIDRALYVGMHVDSAQQAAGDGWDLGEIKIRRLKTVRKALNEVQRHIDRYRG